MEKIRPFRAGSVVWRVGSAIAIAVVLFVAGTVITEQYEPFRGGVDEEETRVQGASPSDAAPSGGESVLPSSWSPGSWAYVVYGVAGLGVVVALVKWRTAYLDRRREELEREIAERTQEVSYQKRQLETYNRELLRTNDQLRKLIEEKSQLLGIAAHDLKNPLFGIRALSEILLEREDIEESVERKLGLIYESADGTLRLIDQLLSSAASTTEAHSTPEPVDVAGLTKWIVHSFEPHVERKDQQLRCSVLSANCVVEGDKRKLREAISNLVSNAVKYTPHGGSVDVVVERENGNVFVEVSDTGPGLSPADQERLFAPFQRLTPEPTGGESSSGLGLYIVKEVVERHDGTIDLDSALGEGSTFIIRLPASSGSADPVPEVEPEDEHVMG